jgi:hypothetical protein
MNEAKITINGRELTEGQSMAVRVAVIAFLSMLKDPKMTLGMGKVALNYQLRLDEVMAMIDDTMVSVSASSMPESELRQTLEFIDVLARRVRSERNE